MMLDKTTINLGKIPLKKLVDNQVKDRLYQLYLSTRGLESGQEVSVRFSTDWATERKVMKIGLGVGPQANMHEFICMRLR